MTLNSSHNSLILLLCRSLKNSFAPRFLFINWDNIFVFIDLVVKFEIYLNTFIIALDKKTFGPEGITSKTLPHSQWQLYHHLRMVSGAKAESKQPTLKWKVDFGGRAKNSWHNPPNLTRLSFIDNISKTAKLKLWTLKIHRSVFFQTTYFFSSPIGYVEDYERIPDQSQGEENHAHLVVKRSWDIALVPLKQVRKAEKQTVGF